MPSNTELDAVSSHEIAANWAGASSGHDLFTREDRQFVAFYDADRNMTVGQRELDSTEWTIARLPEDRKIGWDAHNYVTIHVDDDGYLHLLGNMHAHPLKYFRTTEPLDVMTFERVPEMVGTEEDSVTYPQFIRGPEGELLVKYRDGGSGAGNWIYNVYDHDAREWERFLDKPLTYGGDEMNAYPVGPMPGPDGYYHLTWVWRDNPGAQTNHDLSYARSPDLRNWETSGGRSLGLPIRLPSGEIVDPVPTHAGMINGNTKIGFDSQDRVIISYHKFDHEGNTQIYNARREDDGWEIYETSDWDYRWAFAGGGTIGAEIRIDPVEVEADGRLSQTYRHVKYGRGKWILDPETLQPVEWYSPWHRYPDELRAVRSDHPEMQVNWDEDSGEAPDGTVYALRWEAFEPNRDRAREETPPESTLELHEFRETTADDA